MKLTEVEQAAIRTACQQAEDLDRAVHTQAFRYGVSKAEVRSLLVNRQAAAPADAPTEEPKPKRRGRPKGVKATTPAESAPPAEGIKASSPPVQTPQADEPRKRTKDVKTAGGKLEMPAMPAPEKSQGVQVPLVSRAIQVALVIAALSDALEIADKVLPASDGQRATFDAYLGRLECFRAGVVFAEQDHRREALDGENQG